MRRMPTVEEIIDLIKKYSEPLFEVSNIQTLTDAECNSLKVGNSVAKKTGNQRHNYIVTYKEKNQGLCLSYFDASVVETVSYDYIEGHWVYNSTDVTELGGSGLPEVTVADNEKVLEVVNDAWGIGGKKAKVIDASNIPNPLTSEFVEANFVGGCHINGSWQGLDSPIILGCAKATGDNYYAGSFISMNDQDSHFKGFIISSSGYWSQRNVGITLRNGFQQLKIYSNALFTINDRSRPVGDIGTSNLGTITSTEIVSGALFKNEIAYTGVIGNEDIIHVKMSNGAIYPMINDTANSKLFIYNGVDFQAGSITVSKCWKIGY